MSKNPDSTDFPHWENPRICCTCIYYQQIRLARYLNAHITTSNNHDDIPF